MSLEATLARTNELLEALLTAYTTQVEAPATFGQPEEKAPRKRRTKAEMEADAAAAAQHTAATETALAPEAVKHSLAPVEGDPEGTRYWLIAEKNTVYAQRPGDPDANLPGAVIVSATEYLAKKAEYAKNFQHLSQATAEPTTASAATPAQTTSAASTVSSQPESVSFKQVVDRLQELNRSTLPGHGRDGVMAILTKFGAAKVPALEALGKNAEILGAIDALMAPADADDLGL